MIEISQTAAKEITRIQLTRQKPNSKLRLKVEQGGCFGLFYCLDLESSSADETVETVFNQQQDHYYHESNGIFIVVDAQSYLLLKGMKLDYTEDLMGGGFRFQNPNASGTCSCGISFAKKNTSND
jgi:iron-sulfur cluster assembly protein